MNGTAARVGALAAAGALCLAFAALVLGAYAVGFGLLLAGFTTACLTTRYSLNAQIAVGFVAGVLAGLGIWLVPEAAAGLAPVELTGWVFIKLLKMLVAPLVFLAIASGLARVGSTRGLGSLGARTVGLYLGTMAIAVLTGLLLVNVLEPGGSGEALDLPFFRDRLEAAAAGPPPAPLTFRDFVGSLLDNPLSALASPSAPILPLVFFGLLLGIALVQLEAEAAPLRSFIESAYAVVLRIVGWFIRLVPIGVMAILWSLVGSLAGADAAVLADASRSVLAFIGVVFLATGIHAFVTLPLFAWTLAGVPPLRLLRGISEALMLAFTTSSSAATLPVTTRNVEERLGVPRHVSSFVLPLGATMNMDGTALYEAIAALFIAGLYGVELTLGSQLVVFGMSMLMAVGAPAIPSAGMVTMVVVLQAVGLPAEAVALLIPLDRILDTIRTMANVEGDAVVAVCVAAAEH